jgi:hypothetical protein
VRVADEHDARLKAVLRRQRAKQELGAELVEAVPDLVVARRRHEQMAADLDRRHAVLQGLGDVEDVLDRAAVEDERVAPLELGRRRASAAGARS